MALRATQKYFRPFAAVLAILFMVQAALGCKPVNGAGSMIGENFFLIKICFFLSIGLILAIAVMYFLRGRKGLWILATTLVSAVVLTPATFFLGKMAQDCGSLFVQMLEFDVLIFAALFVLQVISWVFQIRGSRPGLR
jgi:hypothetical protein